MCMECQIVKMTKSSFSSKSYCTNGILELVHIDLFGPMKFQSHYGDWYFILFIDDYSRMMYVMFLKEKFDSFQMFKWYNARVEKETGKQLKCLRSDRGGEFTIFCNEHGIKRQVFALRTPQQNGIVERRNRSIVDYARTLLIDKKVSQTFWKESISTVVYTLNQIQLKKGTNKTPYKLWFGHTLNVSYFKIFGSRCYILKVVRNEKFDSKGEGIFPGYSSKSKAYKCLVKDSKKIVESTNVRVDEFFEKNEEDSKKEPRDYSIFFYVQDGNLVDPTKQKQEETDEQDETPSRDENDDDHSTEPVLEKYVRRNHSPRRIIGDKNGRFMTRSKLKDNTCLISEFEPRIVKDALENEDWMNAMKKEID